MKISTDTLVELVKEGDPVPLSDAELIAVADAACNELRQRMPRYAFDMGDLPDDDPRAVNMMGTAEFACSAVRTMAEAWTPEVVK